MLWIRCCRLRQSSLMGKNKGEEAQKLSFWQTIRSAEGPYGRLYRYVKPYKGRFILGLLFGLAFGLTNSALPIVVMWVSSVIFPGASNPKALLQHSELRMEFALVSCLQRHVHVAVSPIAGDRIFDDALFDQRNSRERRVPDSPSSLRP